MKLFSCFFLSLSFIFINLIDSKLTSFEGHNHFIVKRHTFVRAREMTFNQCDQMARLLVNIWPLKPIKICPIASFFYQSRLNTLPDTKLSLPKIAQDFKILPKCTQLFSQILSHCFFVQNYLFVK